MIVGNSPSEVASLAAEQLEKGLKGVDDVVVSDLAIREKIEREIAEVKHKSMKEGTR